MIYGAEQWLHDRVIEHSSNFPATQDCAVLYQLHLHLCVNIQTNSGTLLPREDLPSPFGHILGQNEYGAP